MTIAVDQTGYLTTSRKICMALCKGPFSVYDAATDTPVFTADAKDKGYDTVSGDHVWEFDFSDLTADGRYYIDRSAGQSDESVRSADFIISGDTYDELHKALIKALYFQRCGCGLEAKYAGKYIHRPCHTGQSVFFEDYMKKTADPRKFDLQGGWHDAGDFGRYTTAASVALGHLLYAYELFPESFTDELNIPESGNGIPDVLNECRYELDWLMKMQAPDGGVYHKLTAYSHAEFIMPEDDHDQFLIYPESSMAAGDFCAVMCLASRVYRPFDPEFSDRALAAAGKAYTWLESNGYVGFHNPEGSGTGEYDDDQDLDERLWAAAEMVRTYPEDTDRYLNDLEKFMGSDIPKTDFGWTDVAGFATMSVLTDPQNRAGQAIKNILLNELNMTVSDYMKTLESSGYRLAMKYDDFVWGSNMVVSNRGMLFILAALMADDSELCEKYSSAAEDHLHYLLGRNALGRSYVTGFGADPVKNIHNRVTACDGIDDPMPGWVSGGPFKTPCDEAAEAVIPEGTPAMKCHADETGSYSTNEITIYWNSPVVFITAYLKKGR